MAATAQRLADFQLKLATKDGVQDFRLSEHLGSGPVVFAFFPLAFSGICTQEVCDVRDNIKALEGAGAKVFGFSADTPMVNREFAKANNLSYGIVSDPNRDVLPRIWKTMEVAGVKNVAKRGVMVVGADGTVRWSWQSDDPKVWVGMAEVRKHL